MSTRPLCIISGILLLLAIPSGWWPYGYYIFLRWVIFVSSIINALGFHKSKLTAWAFIFGAIAFLFNPFFPIYLNKSSWVAIDFITATLFFLSAYSIRQKNERV
ncbi:hypothetical protein KBG31_02310 [Patescibacteria group bacterium]|nr:hypothetical protein [Patescibacteria group bacterium]OQA71189.1 MAG: hypothetical protein BWY34_00078 [Parcubacteria group bacterium ADurb.Bin247]